MHIDFGKVGARSIDKLLHGVVVPRPIALVTTIDEIGLVNAAPFSFFNAVATDPPTVVLGIGPGEGADNTLDGKDTRRNIAKAGEFVVNMVDETLAQSMNVCAFAFAPTVSELGEAGLTAVPSIGVAPPRVAESPASLECRVVQTVRIGPLSTLTIAQVLHLHIRDDLIDAERHYVAGEKMGLIARMHGRGWYARTSDLFQMLRLKEAP